MLERWENFHEKLLVSCWQIQKKEFRNGRSNKKEIFQKTASKFNTVSKDVMVTGEQWKESLSIWPRMFLEFPTGIFAEMESAPVVLLIVLSKLIPHLKAPKTVKADFTSDRVGVV